MSQNGRKMPQDAPKKPQYPPQTPQNPPKPPKYTQKPKQTNPKQNKAWLERRDGVQDAHAPVRTGGDEDVGAQAAYCPRIRCGGAYRTHRARAPPRPAAIIIN